jgi:imidazolonepropionase-like amidohydrolase
MIEVWIGLPGGGTMLKKLMMAGAACLVALVAAAPGAAPAAGTGVTHVWAGTLYAVPGQPADQSVTVIVRDGRVAAIVDGYQLAPTGGETVDLRNKTVLPGMIDCHVHLLQELGPTGRLDQVTKEESDWTLDALINAQKTLRAGFTTVADLGAGQGDHAIFALRDQIAMGRLQGPRIVAAGSTISPTGGHADVHGYRDDVMHVLGRESICDGADDCRRAVRQQVRLGADIIKVTATGGVLSNTSAGLGQQFFDDELVAIVQTAHALGRQVTAHAHGKAGIDAALRAGFDSIEHGSYLDAESIALFRQNNAYLVPTVLAGATVAAMAADPASPLTPAQRSKALEVGPLMLAMLRRAHDGGVKIAFGTDSGVSAHGQNARELELMVEAGFTPLEAIIAATVNAADHLGLAGQIGVIRPGASADLIAVEGDPTANISLMRTMHFVMRAGTIAVPVN